ncbi:MAG: hypothetical protein LBV26_00620 [Bacteroidales bacterium]|nr:hypothetical protein [Bacteroidales bacterium]
MSTLAGLPATHTQGVDTLAGVPATPAKGAGILAGTPATLTRLFLQTLI